MFFAVYAVGGGAQTVATCKGGEIQDDEVRIWLEARLGRTYECAQAVQEIAVLKLLVAGARRDGLDKDPEVAHKMQLLRAMAWRNTAKEFVESKVAPPTDEEVGAFVEKHGREFEQPARIRLGWILRRVAEGDEKSQNEARNLLEEVRGRIIEGSMSFEQAARQYSQSESRYRDGFAGTPTAAEIGPALAEVVFALPEGQMSQVISSPTGEHLFRVEKHIPARFTTAEEITERARAQLARQRREESWIAFKEQIWEDASPVIHLENLSSDDPEAIVMLLPGGQPLRAGQFRGLIGLPPEEATNRLTEKAILMLMPEAAKKRGISLDQDTRLRNDLRRQRLLANEVMERIQDAEVDPPDEEEVAAEWRRDRDEYMSDERFFLRRARFDLRDGADAMERAYRLRDSIQASGSDVQVEQGCTVTQEWLEKSRLSEMGLIAVKEIPRVGKNEIVGPFQNGYDLWLVQVLDRQARQRQPLEVVSGQISRDIEMRRRIRVFKRVYEEYLEKADLKIVSEPSCASGRQTPPAIRKAK